MRRNFLICLLAVLSAGAVVHAADDIAGTYVGDYTNKAGKSGKYQLTFTPGDGGKWSGEVIAVLDGQESKSPMKSLKVQGDTIEATYDFAVQGTKLSSKITGQKSGAVFSGKFETLYEGKAVDTGTWKTSLKK